MVIFTHGGEYNPILPCIEVLKWLINHVDGKKCLIKDEKGGCIGFFHSKEVHKYYKLRDL
jgi:hypothetical protein